MVSLSVFYLEWLYSQSVICVLFVCRRENRKDNLVAWPLCAVLACTFCVSMRGMKWRGLFGRGKSEKVPQSGIKKNTKFAERERERERERETTHSWLNGVDTYATSQGKQIGLGDRSPVH